MYSAEVNTYKTTDSRVDLFKHYSMDKYFFQTLLTSIWKHSQTIMDLQRFGSITKPLQIHILDN